MSLVMWLAIFARLILAFIYLWDELGIPHEEWKQVFGSQLAVIRFDVDPQLMRVLLPFARHHNRQTLQECEHIAGSLNWVLNMKGKTQSKALVWLNQRIVTEVLWAAEHMVQSDGIYLVKSVSWSLSKVASAWNVLHVYCDASGISLGFWYPSFKLGFQSTLPTHPPTLLRFLTLSADEGYNQLLMFVADLILATSINYWVFHISGEWNTIADHLSCNRTQEAVACVPGL
ncbi:hypothetical protein BDR04DRAFT_1130636 [Suillus decipiens]|nr:hypothetical protein BDR04DRAFT_1130636 [Suillus decipiens]